MMSEQVETVPPRLRAAMIAEWSPVRPLHTPVVRALCVIPFAVLLLVAAPLVFERRDIESLGWTWSWGASSVQLIAGFALAAAALQEAVPGRSWSSPMLAGFVIGPAALMMAVTIGSWQASPVLLQSAALQIGVVCLASSAVSAFPATALTSVLALRAFPTRPGITGLLSGLAAGLMADAGWRLFCEFSEPTHVLSAHLGGVVVAGLVGALLTRRLSASPD